MLANPGERYHRVEILRAAWQNEYEKLPTVATRARSLHKRKRACPVARDGSILLGVRDRSLPGMHARSTLVRLREGGMDSRGLRSRHSHRRDCMQWEASVIAMAPTCRDVRDPSGHRMQVTEMHYGISLKVIVRKSTTSEAFR